MMKGTGLASFVVVAAAFVLGAVIGVTADRMLSIPALHEGTTDHARGALVHLTEIMDLDESQVAAIDSVMASHQIRVDSSWSEFRPHLQESVDVVHRHIESVLRPEQLRRFHRWLESQPRLPEAHPPGH